jgi:superfamily II DNA/RNA helicase
MLEQGFQRELRAILYPLLYPGGKAPKEAVGGVPLPPLEGQFKESAPRIILTSATMTQMVQKSLGDNPKTSKLAVTAKKNFVKKRAENDSDNKNNKNNDPQQRPGEPPQTLKLPPMNIISAPGLHRTVPRLDQVFVDVGQTDKISLLVDVVSSQSRKRQGELGATIIFCNTAASVRAVQFALSEARIESLSYHGELNSALRTENLKRFQQGASGMSSITQGTEPITVLICTDLAARGLDIPAVDHVVMFDFPLNALDYLHRSGRTARGDRKGRVTALVAKRDKVLATAIEQAVTKGEALDGLSSRKSDYLPGAKLGVKPKQQRQSQQDRRGPGGGGSGRPQQRTGGVAASRSTSGGGKSKGGGRSGRQGQGR